MQIKAANDNNHVDGSGIGRAPADAGEKWSAQIV